MNNWLKYTIYIIVAIAIIVLALFVNVVVKFSYPYGFSGYQSVDYDSTEYVAGLTESNNHMDMVISDMIESSSELTFYDKELRTETCSKAEHNWKIDSNYKNNRCRNIVNYYFGLNSDLRIALQTIQDEIYTAGYSRKPGSIDNVIEIHKRCPYTGNDAWRTCSIYGGILRYSNNKNMPDITIDIQFTDSTRVENASPESRQAADLSILNSNQYILKVTFNDQNFYEN